MLNEARFGKYMITERLGVGGMAEVFKARLTGIGGFEKNVVIKRILPDRVDDPVFIQMFLDEARIAANLSHPNVIQVFEVGEVDGAPYIAMEYVRGPSLSALIRASREQGKVHLGHAAKIIAGVCAGLHYAHNAMDANGRPLGIVHRDVSPSNILVSADGVPKLVDFGVARAEGRMTHTQNGTFKGKTRYAAPEHLQGHNIDVRSDIFSAGICLYEASTGASRFGNLPEAELLGAAMTGYLLPPRVVKPDYPPELERLVLWAVAPNAEDRCPSAQALHDELEKLMAQGPLASNTAAVSRWVDELFPRGKDGVAVYGKTYGLTPSPQPSHLLQTERSTDSQRVSPEPGPLKGPRTMSLSTSPTPSPAAAPSRKLALAVGAVSALLVVGLVAFFAIQRPSQPPPPVASAMPVAPEPDARAQSFLQEAERLAGEKQHVAALDLLAKAMAAEPKSSGLMAKVVALQRQLEHEVLIAQARTALEAGDAATALETARRALDRDPSDATAAQLLAEARKASSPASKTRVKRTPAKVVVASVTATPPPPPPPVVVPAEPAVSAPKAPQPSAPLPPQLPFTYTVRSTKDLGRVFSQVESQAQERGQLAPAVTGAAFQRLLRELLQNFTPGESIEVYPRSMYYLVVEEAAKGKSPTEIGEQLRAAHLDGSLQARGGR